MVHLGTANTVLKVLHFLYLKCMTLYVIFGFLHPPLLKKQGRLCFLNLSINHKIQSWRFKRIKSCHRQAEQIVTIRRLQFTRLHCGVIWIIRRLRKAFFFIDISMHVIIFVLCSLNDIMYSCKT